MLPILLLVLFTYSQVNTEILPKSFTISQKYFPRAQKTILHEFVLSEAERLDKIDEKNGSFPKIGRSIYTNITLDNSGSWSYLPDGGRVWRLMVVSEGAQALIPYFNGFYLPKGATFHVYTPEKDEVIGAYTSVNNPKDGYFSTGLIHGESCILEYYEPANVIGQGIISLNEVGHAYRWVNNYFPRKSPREAQGPSLGFGSSSSCEVNVNCSEGANWQNQKNAVVCILVQSTQGQGFCTGSMINNTNQDCTPYLISAQHCSEGTTSNQYSQWVFYFNYEAPTCTNPSTVGTLTNRSLTGCTKKADSNDNGGATGSDFLLLELSSQPNANYNVYYEGWDATTTASTSGVSIHHPNADIKKISTYTQTLTSDSWGGSVSGTHWRVKWAATTNGHGVTEPGSSGSPLYNASGLIVGTLTGGDSYCNTPNQPDDYGKMSYHWTSNGNTSARQLKPWLDPSNSGSLTLNGTASPCGSIVTDDAGIQSITSPAGSQCSNSATPVVVLRNYGSNTITAVDINYTIDGTTYTYNWSGNLSSLSSVTVTLPAVTPGFGQHSLSVSTSNPNGNSDNNNGNDTQASSFTLVDASGALALALTTDNYGSETTWEVTDGSSNILSSGGPYTDINGGQTYNEQICLAPGCYTFTIYDTYGDGMSDGSPDGSFTLTGNSGTTTYAQLAASGANFGTEQSFQFCIQGNAIQEPDAINLSVVPNPSNGLFTANFDKEEPKTIRVFDAVGRIVFSADSPAQNISINLSAQAAGVYILQVETKNGKAVKKLVRK